MKNITPRRISHWAGGALITTALLVQGCLQRPVKEQSPNTSNVFVEQIQSSSINEIDMLFVIDNSVSMGDKQQILSVAVPKMVERLITPNCVDTERNVVGKSQLTEAGKPPECAEGSLEFVPVNDIHLGVISSSLGGHGADQCKLEGQADSKGVMKFEDDKGHLVPTMRPDVDQGDNGFLAWNGGTAADAEGLVEAFRAHVQATGENGCGFEAPLEAWYRFLIDPTPPMGIEVKNNRADVLRDDAGNPRIDETVLAQRAAFLRPEGLVAIVVLTDENDCSIMDGGDYYNNAKYGYLLARTVVPGTNNKYNLPVATAACESNPNDLCCVSCLQRGTAPEECRAEVEAACNAFGPNIPDDNYADNLTPEADAPNVRCFNNKKRFGVDLLYPTQRYVDALTRTQIIDGRTGELVDNPLFRSQGKSRLVDRVFFAGIVGVPWQDIATEESLDPNNPDRMRYLTSSELGQPLDAADQNSPNRWDVILGSPNLAQGSTTCLDQDNEACGLPPVLPKDPFMIEQIEPREVGAVNPIVTSEAIEPADSTNPRANNINGHEYKTSVKEVGVNDDLQYACIFPLANPVPPEECTKETNYSCDCAREVNDTGEPNRNRPLCQPPGGGPAEQTQYWGKAYPGTRILQVLRDFGANSIVGSICPKVTDDSNKDDYGYNPAVQAIVDRLAEKLVGACLPRELTIDENGEVPCFVVEARKPIALGEEKLNCQAAGRGEVDDAVRASVLKDLAKTGFCTDGTNSGDGTAAEVKCSEYQMCEILALQGNGRKECLYNTAQPESLPEAGYCYIDPAKKSENGDYIAGGSAQEAAEASHPDTTPTDGVNAIVQDCKATERRLLRFVGQNTPAKDTITLVACTGDAAGSDNPIPTAPTAVEDSTEQ